MSEIVYKISWDNFCNKDSDIEIEKDIKRLITYYAEYLDLRNIDNKHIGPLLADLPKDCLSILKRRIEISLKYVKQLDECRTWDLGLIKLLCLIGRNPVNLTLITSHDIKCLVYEFIDIALDKQSTQTDGSWLGLCEYLLFFLELMYDSTFCWRRRKKQFYSDEWMLDKIEQPVTTICIVSEDVAWIHEKLTMYENDDIRNRLLHLCCCIACGGKENSQFLVSPPIVDSINLKNDSNFETLISFASLTICLAEVLPSERQEDLAETIEKLLHHFDDKVKIRMQDLRILNQLITTSEELTKLSISIQSIKSNSKNKYALYSILHTAILNAVANDNSADTCRLIFRLLASITCSTQSLKSKSSLLQSASYNVDQSAVCCNIQHSPIRIKFRETNGYHSILNYLLECHNPPDFLLDIVFSWAVNADFDASKLDGMSYRIKDGDVVNLLISWASMLAIKYYEGINNEYMCELKMQDDPNNNSTNIQSIVNWKAIFKLIIELCGCPNGFSETSKKCGAVNTVSSNGNCRYGITECCHSNVVALICYYIEYTCQKYDESRPQVIDHTDDVQMERLNRVKRIFEDLLTNLFLLLRTFLMFSVSRTDVVAVIHLFKNKHSQKKGKHIIKLLSWLVEENQIHNVNRWFEFVKPGDCINVLPSSKYGLKQEIRHSLSSLVDRKSLSPSKLIDDLVMKLSPHGFSFNCWINVNRLSLKERVENLSERRCLFRLLTINHNGFEAFFNNDGFLTLATCLQGEYHYIHVVDKTKQSSNTYNKLPTSVTQKPLLTSGKWQMLTIVYQNAKGIFGKSTVSVYLDGLNIYTTDLKYPSCTEPIKTLHFGGCPLDLSHTTTSPSYTAQSIASPTRSINSPIHQNSLPSPGGSSNKTKTRSVMSSLGLFTHTNTSSASSNTQSNKKLWIGDEVQVWGRIGTLKCRLVSIICLNDILTEPIINSLYEKGPMNIQGGMMNMEDNLLNSIIFACHSLGYNQKDACCYNLAPLIQSNREKRNYGGTLYGFWLGRHKFEDVITEIGGVASLLLVIEQLEFMEIIDADNWDFSAALIEGVGCCGNQMLVSNSDDDICDFTSLDLAESTTSGDSDRFIKIGVDHNYDIAMTESALACLFILMRKLCYFGDNQNQIERCKCIPILGALLQKIEVFLLDKNVLLAAHALADHCGGQISRQIYQFILFDWRIWARCSLKMRLEHAKLLDTLVLNEKNLFRHEFGTIFFLDVIKHYHLPENDDNGEDVHKELRDLLFSIIYNLIHNHASLHDYQQILKFIHDFSDDSLIREAIQLLRKLYVSSKKGDDDMMLMYEKNLMESLFVILVRKVSDQTKEDVIELLHIIITNNGVQDKLKTHLLLHDISFAGLFICKEFYRSVLSPESIKHLLDILKKAASKDLFGVVQFLSLLTLSPLDQRIKAMQMVKSFFDKSQDALLAISRQPGWQDILIHLLVSTKREQYDLKIPNNDNKEENDLKLKEQNESSGTGFRRSSTWAVDENTIETVSVTKMKFDEIPEAHDEDDSILEDVIRKELEDDCERESNQDIRSVETMYFNQLQQKQEQRRKSSETFGESDQWATNTISLGFGRLKTQTQQQQQVQKNILPRSTCGSCSSEDQIQQPQPQQQQLQLRKQKISVIYDLDGKQIEHAADLFEEELCELVLDCVSRSVWIQAVANKKNNRNIGPSGDNGDVSSWRNVHEVMESLNSVNERYILIKPIFYFKQQIIMRLLNDLINYSKREDIRMSDKVSHAKELIQLTVDMTSQYSMLKIQEKYDIRLLEQVMCLLQDCLMVWQDDTFAHLKSNNNNNSNNHNSNNNYNTNNNNINSSTMNENGIPNDQQSELIGLGFYFLLTLLNDDDMAIVATVSARLHQVLTCVAKNMSYEEVAFIIVHLDGIMREKLENESYFFVAPVLKTVLEWHFNLLQISDRLPNMHLKNAGFFDQFKIYCDSDEWKSFVNKWLYSGCEIYQGTFLNPMTTVQSLWRAQANEQMSIDRKNRQSFSKEERRKFEKQIIAGLSIRWSQEEKRRRENVHKELQYQHEAALRQWKMLKNTLLVMHPYWRDERDPLPEQIHWRQSSRENHLRMRPRFDPNLDFSPHYEASRERDDPSYLLQLKAKEEKMLANGGTGEEEADALVCIGALEARVADRGEDMLGEEDWVSIQSLQPTNVDSSPPNSSTSLNALRRLSPLFESPCKLIVINEVVEGHFTLTNSHFYFQAQSTNSLSNYESTASHMVYSINQMREVHLRRYNLRRSAIEIFLTDQTNYFFNFDSKTRNKVYSKILSLRPPNLIYSKQRSPADLLRSSNLTQKWVNREISNFEYLMQLNTIAGRTFNDLSQYPVFPWIIADYTSRKLDLDNPKTFRDLSKPIGVVNPKNEKEVYEKYENFEDPNGVIQKFHYGTHYSSAAGVMHYLVRVEPFTTMHIQLQSGKFDVADRQFHSIPLAWNFIMETPNDNKELIPEFFYHPNFLRNENYFNFGVLQQNKTPIDDVELPVWANSPEDFIYQHRQALESEHVSQNLHNWIDLIFGYKQKGTEAVKALNVFYYVTYEGYVDLDQIKDPCERESLESMINNFGQTPCQLLKTPHPRRLSEAEVRSQMIKNDRCLPIIPHLAHLKHTSKHICSEREPIICVRVPPIIPKNLIGGDSKSTPLITVHSSNIFGRHTWYPSLKSSMSNSFAVDVDPVLDNHSEFRKRQLIGNRSDRVDNNSQLYSLSADGRFLICGGDPECRLIVIIWTRRGVLVDTRKIASPHVEPISCVAMDTDGAVTMGILASRGSSLATDTNTSTGILNDESSVSGDLVLLTSGVRIQGVSGGLDGLVVVWDWSRLGVNQEFGAGDVVKYTVQNDMVTKVLIGIVGRVGSVSMSVYLDLVVAGGADDRAVCIWSLSGGYLMHRIILGGNLSAPTSPQVLSNTLISPLSTMIQQNDKSTNSSPINNSQSFNSSIPIGGVSHLIMSSEGSIYIVWSKSQCNYTTTYLTALSLQATHRTTTELYQPTTHNCSTPPFTITSFIITPPILTTSQSSSTLILASNHGDLYFFEGYTLCQLQVLRFHKTILDVQLVSSIGQHLLVALSDGSIILSTVDLNSITN